MKRIQTIVENDFIYNLDVQDSKTAIPEILNKVVPNGITAFWTIHNKITNDVVFGLPVTDVEIPRSKITNFRVKLTTSQ